ncbi:hypothetical protein [Nonomuraea glycinis]|uniref:hypothetical protein n=1 Tax=Nonomuraea glycinis TaxID=2047744 RepID=UPI002E167BC1|nr:hypothetical protein OHA68_14930 [Nonomuraea glycinis]
MLAFGLVTVLLLPGLDPCTGQERTVVLPWLLIVCYPVAAGALYLAARSPLPRRPDGIILWVGAVGAAAWAAMFHRCAITYSMRVSGIVYIRIPETSLDGLAEWSGEADMIGLPVILVALAAAASPPRGRLASTAAAAALLLFPLLDVATYSSDFLPFVDSVRWPLLVAAVLVVSAVRRPRVRISWAGSVHLARSVISERSKNMSPGRTRDLAVAVVIVAAGIWLIVSSLTPTR